LQDLHLTQLTIQPPDYCVTGSGLDAKATTTVNDCYITADDVRHMSLLLCELSSASACLLPVEIRMCCALCATAR
jgi:hypothetical protein